MADEIKVETFRTAGRNFKLKFLMEPFDSNNETHVEMWETAVRNYWLQKARYSAMTHAERVNAKRAALEQFRAAVKASSKAKMSAEEIEAQAQNLLKTLQPALAAVSEDSREFDYSMLKIE